jgi:hypothetical protein
MEDFLLIELPDKSKISIYTNAGKERAVYFYDGKTIVDNHTTEVGHYFVKTLGKKWGYGYEINYGSNTFSNIRSSLFIRSAIEYNFFPYSEVNNRFLTVSYNPFIQKNNYIDTTILKKKDELLYGHMVLSSLTLNQKWGTIGLGIAYRNYFNNWKFYNVGAIVNVNVRITGGLSFWVDFYGNIVHDQVYLSGKGVDKEDVLTRRRQLETSYRLETWFGLTYRFGSILNNFVNPRFDGPGNWVF